MRKGWRELWLGTAALLLGMPASAASPDPAGGSAQPAVRMSVELAWSSPARASKSDAEPPPALYLELTEGQVVEAVGWPGPADGSPERRPDGSWALGATSAGRVRARIEAPLPASLLLRAGDQVVRMPVAALLEGPQHTPTLAGLEVRVERLAWDALSVNLGEGDGTVAPGASVPLSIGFAILTPEATSVTVRCSAELRPLHGGEPLWRQERAEVVATDRPAPATQAWSLPAPKAEGTYLLEVRATWEPVAGGEGSTRLGRWLRRRRGASPATAASASRRVTLAVVGAEPAGAAPASAAAPETRAEVEVESIDLARGRLYRPTASGRAPLDGPGRSAWTVPAAALVEATRRDRIRGWIVRAGPETAKLPPAAPGPGLAWSALGLRVAHPGRPHRLTVSVAGGHPSGLGVALVGQGTPGGRPRMLLDACASGPPVAPDGPPASFSWTVWPDAAEPVLVLVNRDAASAVHLGKVTLAELPEPAAPPALEGPGSDAARTLGLDLTGPNALDRFGGGDDDGFIDTVAQARNLAQYLGSCGATAVVLPEGLADRARRRALDGQAGEDATGPDRLDLLVRLLERRGCSAWLDLALDGPLPGLPAPESPESLARGLVRIDRHGKADGPTYHPLNAEVRDALGRRVAEAAARRRGRPGLAGVLIRLGPGPTLLGSPDTGLDDETFGRFAREMFDAETARTVPGLAAGDPGRFAARARFISGSGRMPWLNWRSKGIAALYAGLAAAARRAAPGAGLAVVTPGLGGGAVGHEARRVDLAGLAPSQAWRAVGLDLGAWPSGDDAPVVLRGVGLTPEALGHDLATSPELDAQVAARRGRGLLLGIDEEPPPPDLRNPGAAPAEAPRRDPAGTGLRLTAIPPAEGPAGDEPLGHGLAALDPRLVVLAAAAVAGREERVLRFARVLRALPAPPVPEPPLDDQPFGVAVRAMRHGAKTYLSLANDTPYPIRVETLLGGPSSAQVDDLGRGLRLKPEAAGDARRLVLDLAPFGVGAVRVDSASVKVGPLTPYPSAAVLAAIESQHEELSAQLARLNNAGAASRSGPANPGFEPDSSRIVQLSAPTVAKAPGGWRLVGDDPANTAELDPERPHSGAGSLRLNAQAPPASAASEPFRPDAHGTLTIQAWLRADRPDARLAVWIEGESGGRPYRRRAEVSVGADWAARSVRTSDVPAAGLGTARLRFELLSAGSLWVDDVIVSGETLTESERSNARRALLAALQAYRMKRYADFARLASSHWTRHPALLAQGQGPVPGRTERPAMIRTGDASPLPSGRRLR